jgi:hypothetical protein
MNLFRIAAYVLTDWPVMPGAVCAKREAQHSPADRGAAVIIVAITVIITTQYSQD